MATRTTISQKRREELGYNPNRNRDLFALTTDGYIVAQDIACQYEFILEQDSEDGNPLTPIAHINRSFQGLSELVALDMKTGDRYSFIFDISNAVYQDWLKEHMGDMYVQSYEGKPRQVDPSQRYFRD